MPEQKSPCFRLRSPEYLTWSVGLFFLFWIIFYSSHPLIQMNTQNTHAPKHHCMPHITKSQTQYCCIARCMRCKLDTEKLMFQSDGGHLREVVALHAKRGHALLCYILQAQNDEEKRDMTDNYHDCRPQIPFILKFDSPREGTHNCVQIWACTCVHLIKIKKFSILGKSDPVGRTKQGLFLIRPELKRLEQCYPISSVTHSFCDKTSTSHKCALVWMLILWWIRSAGCFSWWTSNCLCACTCRSMLVMSIY